MDSASHGELSATCTYVLRSEGSEAAAVIPLRRERARFRRAPVNALVWAIGDIGCPDHLDILAAPETDLAPLVLAIDRSSWDVILLDNVTERAANMARFCSAGIAHGWSVQRLPGPRCPYLELPDSWDDYLRTLSSTRRESVRRKERALYKRYRVTLTDYDPDRQGEGWQRLRVLHALRWGDQGALGDPKMESMHRWFAASLASRADASVWLTTLDLDGVPAAAWYGFALSDSVFFYQGGRDPRWDRDGVGSALMGMMIRRAIERGHRTFDFLRGEEPYKMSWTTTGRRCDRIVVTRRGWPGRGLRLLDRMARWRRSRRETS
jgi:CelD/BcsL family acetyltransferase involved in cellulose biosynthesis